MTFTIREAIPEEDARLDEIAHEGDASADRDYLELLRSQHAVLLVAEQARGVIAFGGVVDTGDVGMVSDLFVTPVARGQGVGGALLRELLQPFERRMTFSSKYPSALPAYRRAGMEPRGRTLYLEAPFVEVDATPLSAASWRHARGSMVATLERQGATVHGDVVLMPEADGVSIARLQSDDPVTTFHRALATCPRRGTIRLCTPEESPVASEARRLGFELVDHDIFCASEGVQLPPDLHCLDPGLA